MLSGLEIKRQRALSAIVIEPFDEKQLNPNSYDVRLAPMLRRYAAGALLDVRRDNYTETLSIPDDGLVLQPGRIYLGSTVERIETDCYVCAIEGKSSLGRLGLSVHSTAGWIDCGFRGTVTLELSVIQLLRIYPHMRIAQLCYAPIEGQISQYSGKYQDQKDAQASRSWQDAD